MMDFPKEFQVEYEVRVELEGKVCQRFGHISFIQMLVNRFGSGVLIRPKDSNQRFMAASNFGFKPDKIYKNVAIAKRRLQETFREPTMFEIAQQTNQF